ncbi:MAG: PQQ-binding-like beta-propeller repeat protein [Acidobacteria bacterium]|nr:PQQ-binding-like beta-propeller repeat protein [Acidobacteriota bacterium]
MKSRARILAGATIILIAAFGPVTIGQVGDINDINAFRDFRPVTDAMLLNPDPADWPNWRRTLDAWGYSPLDQINKQNVHQLQLAWSWGLQPGQSQPAPLVSGGIMYVPIPGGGAQALDGATGELLWEHKSTPAADGPLRTTPMRTLAIYGDKIYIATADARLVALNARTGAVAWDHQVADPKLGYAYSSGPIVVKGMIVAGITGCQRYKKDVCFISAHDAHTGKELWRTSTIARPGEAGGDTWGDLPLVFRAGGDAWIPGSYDSKTDLIYWGTSQAKPWTRFARGTDGDALYTNCTLALDPATGKIVWHYQHIPGETHDMDETFERILVDANGRSSVFTMGKLGILWELDRKDGAFLSAHDLGYQNLLDVDPRTGNATYRPGMIPRAGVELDFCPSASGLKSQRAMAYHPETRAFYIPLNLTCEKGIFTEVERVEGRGGSGGGRRTNLLHPQSPEGIGEFIAMDAKTGKVVWRHRTRTPPNTAALTTGGGLVVVGDWDRYVYIHDAASGKILFQTRLPTSVQGYPVTYAVNGKQYLAVPVGTGGGQWVTTIPRELTPEKRIAFGTNAMFVFALPDTAR